MMLTQENIIQIQKKGLSVQEVNRQLEYLKKGIPPVDLTDKATLGHGIEEVSISDKYDLIRVFEKNKDHLHIAKFVPASGAASRMFEDIVFFYKKFNPEKDRFKSFVARQKIKSLTVFFENIKNFPFYKVLIETVKKNHSNYASLSEDFKKHLLAETLLSKEKGLGYENLPKGLMPFHVYENSLRTAFEEHLVEGAYYATNSQNNCTVHFTVSKGQEAAFRERYEQMKETYEANMDVKYTVDFSHQHPCTDTIAATMDDEFFSENGKLLFRPGGHGALLDNLNAIDADIIFIKNIDNVVCDKVRSESVMYKMVLAGKLLKVQQQIFDYLRKIDTSPSEVLLVEILYFIKEKLCYIPSREYTKLTVNEKFQFVKSILNRPLRVCGMIKDGGKPGGGPFWVRNDDDSISLQIVEKAQIDPKNKEHQKIFAGSTHFNPVDIVCGVKNYVGIKFDLKRFASSDAGFISVKSHKDKKIKTLERPGLWNGCMAYWNTIFVEIPTSTFAPVKTVNNLLDPAHQAN